jgi:DNA-directed RNA polymerase specialized sigma54-like protein
MSAQKYQVEPSQKQRKKLKSLSSRGKESARKLTRTRILLLADNNRPNKPMTDTQIRQILDVSLVTIARIRRQFVTGGLCHPLEEKP